MTNIFGVLPFLNVITTGDILIVVALIIFGFFIASENDKIK
jgi:hypothetical protein